MLLGDHVDTEEKPAGELLVRIRAGDASAETELGAFIDTVRIHAGKRLNSVEFVFVTILWLRYTIKALVFRNKEISVENISRHDANSRFGENTKIGCALRISIFCGVEGGGI